MPRIQQAIGRSSPFVRVQSPTIASLRAPTTADDDYPLGVTWMDQSGATNVIYTHMLNIPNSVLV